jgi:hypothetical protein
VKKFKNCGHSGPLFGPFARPARLNNPSPFLRGTTMINALLVRMTRPVPSLPGAARTRMAVCPPLFVDTEPAWKYSMSRWIGATARRESERFGRLAQVKQEFCLAISEIQSAPAASLLECITRARSLLELWHLRAELYRLVSLHHSQHEAERRLAQLNRHYPTRSPRSGFVPLDS